MYIRLIIIFLIIAIFISSYKLYLRFFGVQDNFESLNNYDLYTNVDKYRIGDVVKGHKDNSVELDKDYVLKNFPDSLAAEYVRKCNSKNLKEDGFTDYKLSLIKNILEEFNLKKNNHCIIHLRVGDIFDSPVYYRPTKNHIYKYLNYNVKKNYKYESYANNLNYYKNIIIELKELNINSVTIIAGSHIKCRNYYLSSYFINIIKQLFEDNGITVQLRLGMHPDEDIKLVYSSAKFYKTKGGYSELLELIHKLN